MYIIALIFFFSSLLTALFIGTPVIKFLTLINAGQAIREKGPLSHIHTKAQTPTIGGLIFLLPFFLLLTVSFILKDSLITKDSLTILLGTAVMAFLGFMDDFLKVKRKHNKGISGWTKLLVQLGFSIFIFLLYGQDKNLLYLVFIFFVIAGAANSYNLTDGLDGLVASISICSFIGYIFLMNHTGSQELVLIISIFLGALAGFLYFNKHQAKVFMGDTGSLAIGGFVGSLAVVTKTEWFLLAFATVPIIEALSVILQVFSCQFSKRALGTDIRIFKMAPLHHHFELTGWSEKAIVARFFLFQLLCVVIGILIATGYLI